MNALSTLLSRHGRGDVTSTAVPSLVLTQYRAVTGPVAAIYHPLLCVVAQGGKRVFLNEQAFDYAPGTYLITSVDLPLTGQVTAAPCLGLTLALDPALLAALLLEMPAAPAGRLPPAKAIAVNRLEEGLLDPILRLLRLLDQPQDIPVLAPLIVREIHYRLLLGPQGEMLRQLARPASQLSQVSRAINAIRHRYDQPIRIEELARVARMSAPSFHRHFRAVTAMSPLQFQKRIRLQEARRRLLSGDVDANRISFDVGYESASQFSREYRRLFGAPPVQDTRQARSLGR